MENGDLRILARDNLLVYAAMNYPGFKVAKHHKLIAEALQKVESGEIKRLIISMPPRHGKSLLASEQFPCWVLGRNPEMRFISATYGQDLATKFGRKVRNQMMSKMHRWIFPECKVSGDAKAADNFATSKRGEYVAVGVGGGLTGMGGKIMLFDDLVKDQEAVDSETQREALEDWYRSVARTRLQPGGRMVMIMTRWSEVDIAGVLLKESANGEGEKWEYLHIPAVADMEDDPLGRQIGEALWPEFYDEKALADIKKAVGSRVWNALYQGRPSAMEGNIFKREWWKYYDVRPIINPSGDRVIISVDCTFKDTKKSDYVAIQVWLARRPNAYLMYRIRSRMNFERTLEAIRNTVAKWPSAQEILIEDKANGPAVIEVLKKEISGIIAVDPKGGKVSRANAVTFLMQGGNVYLPNNALDHTIDDFVEEHASFPNGAFDDEVDSETQGLSFLVSYLRGGDLVV